MYCSKKLAGADVMARLDIRLVFNVTLNSGGLMYGSVMQHLIFIYIFNVLFVGF